MNRIIAQKYRTLQKKTNTLKTEENTAADMQRKKPWQLLSWINETNISSVKWGADSEIRD